MLAACASSGARTPPAPPTEPDPVIEVRYETRVVCPAELAKATPARPVLPAGAVIEANDAGATWLAGELAYSGMLADLFNDAKAACPANATRAPPQ